MNSSPTSDRAIDGRGGAVLDVTLRKAGLARSDVRIANVVPVKAPKDKFELHDQRDYEFGLGELGIELAQSKAQVIVPMGASALSATVGLSPITDWRGSALPVRELRATSSATHEEYLYLANARVNSALRDSAIVLPTFQPKEVARQFSWHPWLVTDLSKAKRIANGQALNQPRRKWYFNNLSELERLAALLSQSAGHAGLIATDTESYPAEIIGFATEDEVHVFLWDESFRSATEAILTSPFVLKVAHNLQHDWTHFVKRTGITPTKPYFDTMGGAHVLNSALEKSLSPAIATRFTDWPFHKWLVGYDALWYNGLDCIVAYDAYWPQMNEIIERDLYGVAAHDHQLLEPLLDMQWFGFKVNESERQLAEAELGDARAVLDAELGQDVEPIVSSKLAKFEKPHLFERMRKCECCGGGKTSAQHCWRCGGLPHKPTKKSDYITVTECEIRHSSLDAALGCERCQTASSQSRSKVAELRAHLPTCRVCGGGGKIAKRQPFNPDSSDQVADVLYRGLGIRARKYKGAETTRVGQLEGLAGQYPLVEKLVKRARVNADYETVARLRGGADSRLHCVLDPFGTEVGRVAGKEGLIEVGTNPMNIPKKARRLVVPDEGYVILQPDLEAVEARALAVLSKDKALIELLNDGGDMHTLVMQDVWALGIKGFSRQQAKRTVFAGAYGGEANQVAKELTDEAYRLGEGVPINERQADLILQSLFANRLRGMAAYRERVEKDILQSRKVRNITGRERTWLEYVYDKKTKGVLREILKQGWAFGPQDIGGWILGEGLIELKKSKAWGTMLQGLIHVHDALVIQALIEHKDEAAELVTRSLTREKWGMKFTAKVKSGANWAEAS